MVAIFLSHSNECMDTAALCSAMMSLYVKLEGSLIKHKRVIQVYRKVIVFLGFIVVQGRNLESWSFVAFNITWSR